MNILRKIISFCFSVLFCSAITWAQCPQEDVRLETQADVNEFPILYPNCTELDIFLRIGTALSDTSDIADLSPLNQITSVGDLRIISTRLTDLSDLENLTSIEGFLSIWGNHNLLNLNGLQNVTSIKRYLNITTNSSLVNLSGLENLTSVGEFLWILDNFNLIDLSALYNLNSIEASLMVRFNGNLSNLNGLQNISHTTIAGLYIYENPNLSICDIQPVCDYIINEGATEIYNNAANCNSAEEILALCTISTTTPDDILQFAIFPNPTNGIFAIQGISDGTYEIHSTSGQIIRQGNIQNDLLIDISREVQGVYFISITADNTTSVRRIVKM